MCGGHDCGLADCRSLSVTQSSAAAAVTWLAVLYRCPTCDNDLCTVPLQHFCVIDYCHFNLCNYNNDNNTNNIVTIVGQVQQMKWTWDAKEKRLTDERDKAIAAAAAAGAKLRDVDDAFRRQLDAMETSHRAAVAQLMSSKQAELDAAQSRTVEVEEEMRMLLRETDSAKQNVESRIRKLTSAFADLQQDLIR